MAYFFETGAATDLDDLYDKMVDFAVANAGFTEITQVSGTGRQSDMYILQRGSMYWWFVGNSTGLGGGYGTYGIAEGRMMTKVPTWGNRLDLADGQRYITKMSLWNRYDGPFTAYYFYSNGQNVHVVVETTPNVFTHWNFGVVNKFSTWTGGEFLGGLAVGTSMWYVTGGYWNYTMSNYGHIPFEYGWGASPTYGGNYIYYPQDSYGDQQDFALFYTSRQDTQQARGVFQYEPNQNQNLALVDRQIYFSPHGYNNRTVILPSYIRLWNTGSQRLMILGHADNIKVANMDLINPKETVEVLWDIYPLIQKVGDNTVAPVSGNIAYALRRA